MVKHYRLLLDLKVEIGEKVQGESMEKRNIIETLMNRFLENDEALREFFRMRVMEELNQGDLVAGWDRLQGTPEEDFWKAVIKGCRPEMEKQFQHVVKYDLESLYEQIGEFELVDIEFDQIQYEPGLFDILDTEKTDVNGKRRFPQTSILLNASFYNIHQAYLIKLTTGFHLLVRHFDVVLFDRLFVTEQQARDEFARRFKHKGKAKQGGQEVEPEWSCYFDYGAAVHLWDSLLLNESVEPTFKDLKISLCTTKHLIAGEL